MPEAPDRSQAATAAPSSAAAAAVGQVALDEEHRRGVPVQAEPECVVDGKDRLVVEQLEGDRVERRHATIAATASPAAGTVGKNASIVDRGGGATWSRSVASVMIPSVPCDPTKRWVRA